MRDYKIGSYYTFDTKAPSILGATIKNAKLIAILDYEMASNFITPATSHANIYPYLPQGTVDDYRRFVYLLFETPTVRRLVMADPWINEASVIEVNVLNMSIIIPNVTVDDSTKVRDILLLAGYNPTITIS